MWTQNIRQLLDEELCALRDRWLLGASVLGWATHDAHGIGVADPEGSIEAQGLEALVELHVAGVFRWQGRVLLACRYRNAHGHWSYVERNRDGLFTAHDRHGLYTPPMPASMVPLVVRDFISVSHFRRDGGRVLCSL